MPRIYRGAMVTRHYRMAGASLSGRRARWRGSRPRSSVWRRRDTCCLRRPGCSHGGTFRWLTRWARPLPHTAGVTADPFTVAPGLIASPAVATGRRGARLREALVNVGMVSVSLSLAFGLGELAVRFVAPQQLIVKRPDIWQPADTLGWTRRPNVNTTINTGERTVRVITDHDGFRVGGAGRVESKRRILLLGDSFMEALQVEYEQSLARLLEARPPGGIPSVSLAAPGAALAALVGDSADLPRHQRSRAGARGADPVRADSRILPGGHRRLLPGPERLQDRPRRRRPRPAGAP